MTKLTSVLFHTLMLKIYTKVQRLINIQCLRIKEESRSTQCQKEENWTKVLIYIYKKHIDAYIHYYGSPLEILDKMYYYKGKYEKYYNTWYRRFWHKIRPRSKRRR